MTGQFSKFKRLHGAPSNVVPVADEVVESYRGRLPDDLLTEWQDTGWCSYFDGFLWLVDPAQYEEVFELFLPESDSSLVFMRTAFGSPIYWDGADAALLDVVNLDTTPMFDEMDWVFDGMLTRAPFLDDVLDRDYFLEALPRLGAPGVDECYGYFPPKAMGGDGTPDTLQKVKLREHLTLLAQLRE